MLGKEQIKKIEETIKKNPELITRVILGGALVGAALSMATKKGYTKGFESGVNIGYIIGLAENESDN